jgi:hypothetical protein
VLGIERESMETMEEGVQEGCGGATTAFLSSSGGGTFGGGLSRSGFCAVFPRRQWTAAPRCRRRTAQSGSRTLTVLSCFCFFSLTSCLRVRSIARLQGGSLRKRMAARVSATGCFLQRACTRVLHPSPSVFQVGSRVCAGKLLP